MKYRVSKEEAMTEREPSKLHILIIYAVLTLATLVAYEPVRHNDFVGIDDPDYITKNPDVKAGLTRRSVVWAFTTSHSANWHSLTWLSHMLDCELFGLNPLGHHLTSLFLHIANSLLLFLVLKKMTAAIWPSAFVAAAFALHPLHVESVAWAAERKDVLSGLFWMLAMIAYARYSERPGVGAYLLVILALCLGLLSKPMLVTFPFALLLLDFWPLSRLKRRERGKHKNLLQSKQTQASYKSLSAWRLITEKVPFFVLVVLSSIVTFLVQQKAGATGLTEKLSLNFRLSNALVSYVRYMLKMVYPSRLAVFYPLKVIPSWQPVVCLLILVVISVLVVVSRRRYLTIGWLWYLGTLVPVIGLVQVGSQAMADRYTYLPSIGIFIMVAWGSAELFARLYYWKTVLGVTAAVVLISFLVCTRIQVRHWNNNIALYGHTVAVTENNFRIHCSYGGALYEDERFEEAIHHFKETLRIKPDYWKARNGLGKAFLELGYFDNSITCFNKVLDAKPDWAEVYGNLGLAYVQLGKDEQAIANWTKTVELDPNSVDNLNNLAWLLATSEDPKLRDAIDAVEYAERACELAEPNQPTYRDTLAAAYAATGDFAKAVETAEQALKLAEAAGESDVVGQIQERLQLYKSGRPYRKK